MKRFNVTRRGFWRMVAGAVAALAAPRLMAQPKRGDRLLTIPEWKRWVLEDPPVPITLAWMEHVYQSLSYGNLHPTMIRVSQRRFDELWNRFPHTRFDRDILNLGPPDPQRGLRFNGAWVMVSGAIDDDHMFFWNKHRPLEKRFHCLAKIGWIVWYDGRGFEHKKMEETV